MFCHNMVLLYYKTSCTFLCPSIASFAHKKCTCLYGGLDYTRTLGMVQGWVSQKALNRNILIVFLMSDLINLGRLLVKTHNRKRLL